MFVSMNSRARHGRRVMMGLASIVMISVMGAAAVQGEVPTTALGVEVDASTPVDGAPMLRSATLSARKAPIDHVLRVELENTGARAVEHVAIGVLVRDARDRARGASVEDVSLPARIEPGTALWAHRYVSLRGLRATRGDRVIVRPFETLHEPVDLERASVVDRSDGLQLVVPRAAAEDGIVVRDAHLRMLDEPLDYDVELSWEGKTSRPASTQVLAYDVFDQRGAARGGGSLTIDVPAQLAGLTQQSVISLPLGAFGLQRGDTIRLRWDDPGVDHEASGRCEGFCVGCASRANMICPDRVEEVSCDCDDSTGTAIRSCRFRCHIPRY